MRVVGAIIQNSDGEYLLQLRDEKPKSYPLHWSLFGGEIEKDETPEQAIKRELLEEINLAIINPKLIQHNIETDIEQFIFFVQTDKKTDELTLHEGKAMKFIPENELFERGLAFNIRAVLKKYIDYKNN